MANRQDTKRIWVLHRTGSGSSYRVLRKDGRQWIAESPLGDGEFALRIPPTSRVFEVEVDFHIARRKVWQEQMRQCQRVIAECDAAIKGGGRNA